jgi:tetratricopeptide (TPR) repeat protein
LRDPENPPAAASASGNSTIWAIFDDSIACLPESEIDRARAIALSDQAVEKVDPSLMQQAIAALEKTLSRDSDDSEAWRSLAFLYAIRRDPAKAKLAFEAALQADSGDELSLKNLGLLAYRTRSLDTARRSYDAYMALNPWDPTMFGPYSAILATAGDLQGAIAAAERGLELDPTLRELRSMTAKLYERLGGLAKSEEHVKKLRIIRERLDPWDQQRRERLQREAEAVRQANP